MRKFKIKKGDTVIVIAGKDKGKEAKVEKVLPKEEKLILDGLNLSIKHIKPSGSSKSGQIVQKAMPIHISNVQLKDPKSGKPTRLRYEIKKDKKVRVAVKSNTEIK